MIGLTLKEKAMIMVDQEQLVLRLEKTVKYILQLSRFSKTIQSKTVIQINMISCNQTPNYQQRDLQIYF